MLHDIVDKSYCGPAVLQALTGLPLKPIREAINEIRGRKPSVGVLGMWNHEIEKVLEVFGFKVSYREWPRRDVIKPLTLEKFGEVFHTRLPVIVNVTKHFVIMENGMVADNRIRYGCPLQEHPSRRQHVKAAFVVVKKEGKNAF